MRRTLVVATLIAFVGVRCALWLTDDLQVWTAEGARRLSVAAHPVDTPDAALVAGSATALPDLRGEFTVPNRMTIVEFVYTRCDTLCSSAGSEFQRLQKAVATTNDDDVRLLTISFDPARDDASSLARYAARWHADVDHWKVVTIADAARLAEVLRAFEVVVIDDGLGGFTHNAALLVVDDRARLVRVFDQFEGDAALAYARASLRRQRR